jgi:hypothetical protein
MSSYRRIFIQAKLLLDESKAFKTENWEGYKKIEAG